MNIAAACILSAVLVALLIGFVWAVAKLDRQIDWLPEIIEAASSDEIARTAIQVATQQYSAQIALWSLIVTATATAFTLVGIVVAAVFAGRQILASRQALEIQSRAYVHFLGIRWISHTQSNGSVFWRIWVDWINTGSTPGNRVKAKARLYSGEHDEDQTQSTSNDEGVVIRAGGVLSTGPFPLETKDIDSSIETNDIFIIEGIVTYSDVFSKTTPHQTRFRVRLVAYTGDITKEFHSETNPVDMLWANDEAFSQAT